MRKMLAAAMLAVAAVVGWQLSTLIDGTSVAERAAGPVPQAAPSAVPIGRFQPTDPPRPAPGLTVIDGEGRRMDLADFRGKAVLLNLWATWCGPCVKEMPALDRLQSTMGGRDFEVVAVSQDRGGRNIVAPFFEKEKLSALPMYLDPQGGAMAAFKPRGLPTSILIDRNGDEIGRVEGDAHWDGEEAAGMIRRLIDQPAAG
jgi:thiol-disulfide isomerase/thioredoxin